MVLVQPHTRICSGWAWWLDVEKAYEKGMGEGCGDFQWRETGRKNGWFLVCIVWCKSYSLSPHRIFIKLYKNNVGTWIWFLGQILTAVSWETQSWLAEMTQGRVTHLGSTCACGPCIHFPLAVYVSLLFYIASERVLDV